MSNQLNRLTVYNFKSEKPDLVWQRIQHESAIMSDWGANTLRDGLAGYTQSIILETNYTCKDYRNLFSNFYSKKFNVPDSFCHRLHFFNTQMKNEAEAILESEKYQDSYIGYSIIRPIAGRCLGRTVIDPEKIGYRVSDGFYCLRTKFSVNICGAKYHVFGYPYMSQDTDATVCAHSALWGVCRYLSERYSHYKEVFPFDLIRMTGDTDGRTYPYRGMTYQDYSTILSEFGCFPLILRIRDPLFTGSRDEMNFMDLCTYIESGFPVLASYPGHVVGLCGHTINYEEPYIPDSNGFVSSTVFLKQFMVVDDNFFPYQLLGRENNVENYGDKYPQRFSIDKIMTAVCPLPEKAFMPADKARDKALATFSTVLQTLKIDRPLIYRLLLTTCGSFKNRKLAYFKKDGDPLHRFVSQINFPHFIWLAELYSIDGYRKGRCAGEVVLDATAGTNEECLLYARIGNFIYYCGERYSNNNGPMDYPQYTHNLGEAEL